MCAEGSRSESSPFAEITNCRLPSPLIGARSEPVLSDAMECRDVWLVAGLRATGRQMVGRWVQSYAPVRNFRKRRFSSSEKAWTT